MEEEEILKREKEIEEERLKKEKLERKEKRLAEAEKVEKSFYDKKILIDEYNDNIDIVKKNIKSEK